MYINTHSRPTAVDRLNQVNATLTRVLRTLGDAPTDNSAATFRPASLPTALSGPGRLNVTRPGSFTNSLGGLLSSVSTAADSASESRLNLGKVRAPLETILSVATEVRDNHVPHGELAQGQLVIDRAVAEIDLGISQEMCQ